jgi:hypothetical protein
MKPSTEAKIRRVVLFVLSALFAALAEALRPKKK